MAYTTVGINVKVEGGKEFQSEMKAAAAQARQLDAELKNLTSSLDGSESSIGNAKEAINGYQTKISNCQTVIDRYNEELKRQQTSQDGTKESIANCQRTIANWTAEQDKAKQALKNLNAYLKEHSTEIINNKQKLEQLDSKLKENTTALKNNQVQLSNNKKDVKLLTEQRQLLQERSSLLSQKEEALKEKIKLTSDAFGENSKEVQEAQQQYRELSTEIVTNNEKLVSNYNQVVENTNAWTELGEVMEGIGSGFTAIGEKLGSIGKKLTTAVSVPLVGVGTSAISAASDVQQYHNQFSALLKSSEKADELWDKLQNYGIKSPFDVTGLADSAKQLLGFGFSAEDTYDTLKTLGNVAMGDADHLYNIARAYGQVVSQGKLSKRYLNAMVNNDFSPYLALADYLGTSAEEVQTILSDTKQTSITVETLQKAIEASAQDGGRYYGMLDAMNDTLKGQIANLREGIWAIGAKFGSYFLEPLRDIVKKIAEATDKVGEWDEEQVKAAVNVGLFAAALGPLLMIVGKVTKYVGSMLTTYGKFCNQVGRLGNIISKSIGGGSVCIDDLNGFEKVFYKVFSGSQKAITSFKEKFGSIGGLFQSLKGFSLKDSIGNFFQGKIDASPVAQSLKEFKQTFSTTNQELMTELSGHWGEFKQGWSESFSNIKQAGNELFNDLKTIGTNFVDRMSDNWTTFKTNGKQVFSDFFTSVQVHALDFADGIKTNFKGVIEAVKTDSQNMSFSDNFTRLQLDFMETCDNTKQLAKDTALGIKQKFRDVKDYFNPSEEKKFASYMGQIKSHAEGATGNVKSNFQDMSKKIAESFNWKNYKEKNSLSRIWSNFKNDTVLATSQASVEAQTSFALCTKRMKSDATQIGKNISTIFHDAGSKIKNVFVPSEGDFSNFQRLELDVQQTFSNIQQIGDKFYDKFLSKPVNWVKDTGSTIGTFIKDTFISTFDAIKDTVNNCADFIKKSFTTAFDAVKSSLSTLKTHFSTVFGEVKKMANSTGTLISKTFKSVMEKVGKDKAGTQETGGLSNVFKTMGESSVKGIKSYSSKILSAWKYLFAPAAIIAIITTALGVVESTTGGKISEFINKLKDQVPAKLEEFSTKILDKLPEFMENGTTLLTAILDAMTALLPAFGEVGTKLFTSITESISNMDFGAIISSIVSFLGTLITTIISMLPSIIEMITSLCTSLITGLVNAMPTIIGTITQILTALIQALAEGLPLFLQSGLDMLMALADGIINNLDTILAAIGTLITTLVTALIENGPQLVQSGCELLLKFVEGFGYLIGHLAVKAGEIVVSLGQYLIEHGPEIFNAACDLMIKLILGIGSMVVSIGTAIGNVGKNLVTGLWGGIKEKWDWLKDKVKGFCDKVIGWFKGDWDINSPSGETKKLGENLGDGVGEGLDDSEPSLGTKVGEFCGNVLKGIKDAFEGGDEETVNVRIDFSQAEQDANTGLENIKSVVATKYGEINELFKSSNTTIVTDTKTQYEELSSVAVTTVTNMVTDMVAALTTLKSSFDGLFDDLTTDTVKQVALLTAGVIAEYGLLNTQSARTLNITLQTAVKKFTLMKEECLVVVKLMITQIVTTIGRLPAEFNTIGQKMMTELKKGITNNKQQVIDETSALVKKLVAVFVEGLGIHSPARKMVWIGEMMIAGLMKGLSNSQLMKFTSNTVQKLEDAFANGKLSMGSTIEILKSGGVDALIAYLNDKTTNSSGSDSKKSGATAIYPLEGGPYEITSWFGARPASDTNGIGSTNHGGIDIGAGLGTAIKSMAAGTVTLAGDNGGYGNCVIIDHGNGLASLYGHMSEIGATLGQTVAAGQSIGKVGSTGNSTGPHLHFEVRQNGEKIDPYPYLQGAAVVGGNALANALQTAKQLMESGMTKEQINAMGSSLSTAAGKFTAVSGDLATWIKTAMAITGEPATSFNYLYTAAMAESGGDPTAINLWDSNAAAGNPSKGLMQTIQTTFDAYKMTGFDNVWDPISNLIASIRYMRSRYGSVAACCLPRMNGWYGYKVGTRKVPYDMLAQIHAGEAILPADQNPYSESGGDYLTAIVAKVLNKATDVANKNVEVMVATNANNSGILNTHVNTGLASEAEDRKLNRIINVALEGVSRPSNNETNYTITQNFDTHNPSPSEIARSTKNMIRKLNR